MEDMGIARLKDLATGRVYQTPAAIVISGVYREGGQLLGLADFHGVPARVRLHKRSGVWWGYTPWLLTDYPLEQWEALARHFDLSPAARAAVDARLAASASG